MTTSRIMVVEDDSAIAAPLTAALRAAGHDVLCVGTGTEAVSSPECDLVLLDLGLPDVDGVEVCRRIRALQPSCVIVVLTARLDEADVLVALDAGADDYLTKPFRLAELLARVRAHLRRSTPAEDDEPVIESGGVVVDQAARRVTVGGVEVSFRPKEFDLVAELVRHSGEAVRREELMARVWDENWFGSTKTLDMHVSSIRRRLAEAGAPDGLVTTMRGYGYRWESPSPAE